MQHSRRSACATSLVGGGSNFGWTATVPNRNIEFVDATVVPLPGSAALLLGRLLRRWGH